MRTRVKISLTVLLVLVVGTMLWQMLRPREPVYDGKPISYWISRSGEFYWGSDFGRIGGFAPRDSNAVPYLLKALERQDTTFSLTYRMVWFKMPYQIQSRLPLPISAEQMRFSTAMSLGKMGDIARPAIPALLRAAREDKSIRVRGWAACSLGQVGKGDTNVIRVLTESLNDRSSYIRAMAAHALAFSGGAAQSAAPSLIRCLDDKDDQVSCPRLMLSRLSMPTAL
jgi:HEAT repeat protein